MKIDKSFNASEGWLSHWKKKYNIKKYAMSGEQKSADIPASEKFKVDFEKFINDENLQLCQIFNVDETGLNFKLLPNKTLSEKDYRPFGIKQNKDRITVMPCTNADGSLKLPLVVIGKSAKPRALKNCINNLPVYYTHQSKAWMNSVIFEKWFKDEFVPKVTEFLKAKKLPIKAVLTLDNAPCHPSVEKLTQGHIKAYYYPPNTTSILQPLDQGIIENWKRHYRFKFIKSILDAEKNGINLLDHLKSVTIKDVIEWSHESWELIQDKTIFKCWKKALPKKFYENSVNNDCSGNVTNNVEISNNEMLHQVRQMDGFTNVDSNLLMDWIDNADKDSTVPANSELIEMVCGIEGKFCK